MSSRSQKYSSDSEFFIKNKSVIVFLFILPAFFILLVFFDCYVLPNSKATDKITNYFVTRAGGKNGSTPQKIAYHYSTEKGFTFSTGINYIEEDNIEIEYSLLFKSVTKVRSKYNNYSDLLSNGVNIHGIQFYLCCIFLFSTAISLKILLSNKFFSENTFYNMICFNGLILFLCFYMAILF